MINIHARVKHLIQKYGTRDPEKLAKELKITIIKRPFKKTMVLCQEKVQIKMRKTLSYFHILTCCG
ncbi:hypothetical protein ACJDU8_23085, partial [Clostridium sp. WILCCON 0269]